MKKNFWQILSATVLCALLAFGLTACVQGDNIPPATGESVTVEITSKDVTINEGEAFDAKTLFTIKADGKEVTVTDTMLSLGGLNVTQPRVGEFTVTLNYTASDGKAYNKTSTVKVVEVVTEIVVVEIISVDKTINATDKFDCKALFTVYENSVEVTITNEMLDLGGFNPESPDIGNFTIKLTYVSSDNQTYEKTAKLNVEFWTDYY